MSERTGATAKQVDDAVASYCNRYADATLVQLFSPDGTERTWVRSHRSVLEWWLPHIVPEGQVIVPAADVISPELKAAMGRIDQARKALDTERHYLHAEDHIPMKLAGQQELILRTFAGNVERILDGVSADLALLRAASKTPEEV